MNQNSVPKLSKVPFLIGDALMVAAAGWLVLFSHRPLDIWHAGGILAAVAIGAWLGVMPFVMQFNAEVKFAETAQLTTVTEQLGNLEALARQISSASSEWQHVHQSTTQTVTAADQIAEKMIAETRNFGEVLTRMNEAEKHHLRLEVEKFRRAEKEWLQAVVRMLDHVHALHQAGLRSGQRPLVEQLTHFQNACRETVRRLGLVPILPDLGATFDPGQHQVLEDQTVSEGAFIREIIAPGYSFQGQILRLPVVALQPPDASESAAGAPPTAATPEASDSETQLSFEDQAGAGS